MSINYEIERTGCKIKDINGVIYMLLESCDSTDKESVMNTINCVCYMTEYIEMQADKLLVLTGGVAR